MLVVREGPAAKTSAKPWTDAVSRALLPEIERTRLESVELADAGHGYDVFGANLEWIRLTAGLLRPFYDSWFRVTAYGDENLPETGPGILAANHSGFLPFDAAMLWADVLRRTEPPRVLRPVLDHFVCRLPFFGTLLARTGAVGGSRDNLRALLDAGELLLVFPEGPAGANKPFARRYELQTWHVGHAELALRHEVPVIPTAVIGAEEQMPQLGRLRAPWRGRSSYLSVPVVPVPLPVHYHVWYGQKLMLHEHYASASADDPAVLRAAANEVRAAVEELVQRGLTVRSGVFR